MLPLFKKKLTEMEAPSVLAEIVKVILENTAFEPASIIRQIVPLPSIPSLPGKEYFIDLIAKIIVSGIPREKALEILKEIKEQLKEYKV